jgi:hypothetical protein
MLKQIGSAALRVGVALIVLLVCLEGGLRLLPVHGGTHLEPVRADNPILHYQPSRVFTWSTGPTFHMVNRVEVNNYGFVSDQDYIETAVSPLMAVIGDSYIEAFQLEWEDTVSGRLSAELGDRARVYPFAVSGSPLSQYLAFAEYATHKFHAKAAVINVVGTDFDESLLEYKHLPGYHYFADGPGEDLVLKRLDYSPNWLHQFVRKFALARYLFINADVSSLPRILGHRWEEEEGAGDENSAPRYALAYNPALQPEHIADSQHAVREFLDELPIRSGLCPKDVLFVLDAVRPGIYDEEGRQRSSQTYFGRMREYFIAEATARGHEVVDLQPLFVRHFREHGQRFEMPITALVSPRFGIDNHWSPLGHEVAFEGVKNSRFFERFVRRSEPQLLQRRTDRRLNAIGRREGPAALPPSRSPRNRPVRG